MTIEIDTRRLAAKIVLQALADLSHRDVDIRRDARGWIFKNERCGFLLESLDIDWNFLTRWVRKNNTLLRKMGPASIRIHFIRERLKTKDLEQLQMIELFGGGSSNILSGEGLPSARWMGEKMRSGVRDAMQRNFPRQEAAHKKLIRHIDFRVRG